MQIELSLHHWLGLVGLKQCRVDVLQTLQWVARYKPKQLARTSCVTPLLQALCAICAESLPEDVEDAADESSAPQLASEVNPGPTFQGLCRGVEGGGPQI